MGYIQSIRQSIAKWVARPASSRGGPHRCCARERRARDSSVQSNAGRSDSGCGFASTRGSVPRPSSRQWSVSIDPLVGAVLCPNRHRSIAGKDVRIETEILTLHCLLDGLDQIPGCLRNRSRYLTTGVDCTLGIASTALTSAATVRAAARTRGAATPLRDRLSIDWMYPISDLQTRVRHVLRDDAEERGVASQ